MNPAASPSRATDAAPGSRLFEHWSFASFAPGTISRRRYNAFQGLALQTERSFELLAQIEELAEGRLVADWSRVNALVGQLIKVIHELVECLRVMNPVEFMDVHEWSAKLGFYARLAVDHDPAPAGPPYLLPFSLDSAPHALTWTGHHLRVPDGQGAALALMPSLYAYYVEANDLRPGLDSLLRDLNLHESLARQVMAQSRDLLEAGSLPQSLADAMEIAAVELAPRGGLLDLRFFVGQGADWRLLHESTQIRPLDIAAAWKSGLAQKFSFPALCDRLSLGLTDEEHLLVTIVTVAGTTQARFLPQPGPDAAGLVQRLEQVLHRVTHLHAQDQTSPKNCRSLHDLVCLCQERGLARIFALVGEPGRSLSGIKELRPGIPVTINVFNLGDGLFPSAAERSVIFAEDIRSIPAWSLLLGLTSNKIVWPEASATAPHASGYAVMSQFFMHYTLRMGGNFYMIECQCGDGAEKYIRFSFKGGCSDTTKRQRRLQTMRLVLEEEEFCVTSRGDYLQGVRPASEDVHLQRNLVCLGLLIAWMQTANMDVLDGTEQGTSVFRQLLHQK